MNTTRSLRVILLTVMVVGAVSAGGPGITIAYFEDTHDGTGTLSADVGYSTNPGQGPPDDPPGRPFNDADGDGEHDSGEQTYSSEELRNFDNTSANLVIPDGIETIEASGQDDVSIRAGNIVSDANVSAKKGNIDLEATNGSVVFENASVSVSNGQGGIDVTASENVSFAGSTVSTKKGPVDVTADGAVNIDKATISISNDGGSLSVSGTTISAVEAALQTKKQSIDLTATADGIDLTNGSVTVNNGQGDVDVTATDDVILTGADLSTQKGGIEVQTDGLLNLNSATVKVTNGQASVSFTGRQITAVQVEIHTKKGGITLAATSSDGGSIDASNAIFTVANGQGGITFKASGDMTLDSATLTTKNGPVTAGLGKPSATLSVDQTTIDDSDGTLVYDPDGISVVGSSSSQTSP